MSIDKNEVFNRVVYPIGAIGLSILGGLSFGHNTDAKHILRAETVQSCIDQQPGLAQINDITQQCLIAKGIDSSTVEKKFKIGDTLVSLQNYGSDELKKGENFTVMDFAVPAGAAALSALVLYPILRLSTRKDHERYADQRAQQPPLR